MRSTTISTIAYLATSLLVKDVVAGRFDARKRDEKYAIENVWVTEEVTVTKNVDGSLHTGKPVPVTTVTLPGGFTTVVVKPSSAVAPSVAAPSSSTPEVKVAPPATSAAPSSEAPKPAPSSSSAAVFVEKPKSSAVVVPTVEAAKPTTIAAPTTLQSVAKPSSTAAPAPASSAAPVTTGGKKRGIAYNNAAFVQSFVSGGQISWAYNWASGSGGSLPSGVEFVPLCWGQKSFANWAADAKKAIAAGSKHLLGFNEPDHTEQANMSPADAITAWKAQMQPFAGQAALGAPAVTNGLNAAKTMGIDWLSSFVKGCSGCTIDFVPIHWYQTSIPLTNAIADFKQHCKDAYAAGGNKPLWITEFQYTVKADENAFLAAILPWLDAPEQSYIQRYSYFMAADGNLISGTGLSTTGKTYATTV
ncbi:glycosyl hydrolase catalytic core-domain-containing protein [Halenospora varia]|nr:glycosyl hydrolase catalytic core-domain-containing protein [Halenospora varia]